MTTTMSHPAGWRQVDKNVAAVVSFSVHIDLNIKVVVCLGESHIVGTTTIPFDQLFNFDTGAI